MAFLYQSMKHFHTHTQIFVMCISEFYFRANVTNTLTQKCHFLVVFCTPVNSWNKSFIVILTCTFLQETFLLENRYIKTKILQYLSELKLIFNHMW